MKSTAWKLIKLTLFLDAGHVSNVWEAPAPLIRSRKSSEDGDYVNKAMIVQR